MKEKLKAVLGTVLCLAFIGVVIYYGPYKSSRVKRDITDCSIDYQIEKELAYWTKKAELVEEVDNYIHSIAPGSALSAIVVVDACEEYNVDVAFVLAQGHMESHFGTKGLASRTNSVWNVGAFDGFSVEKIDGKYKFRHPDQSVRPYLALITTKYIIDGKTEYDMFDKYETPGGQRYATYPHYEREIKVKYDTIMSTSLGERIQEFNRAKLIMNR